MDHKEIRRVLQIKGAYIKMLENEANKEQPIPYEFVRDMVILLKDNESEMVKAIYPTGGIW